MFTIQFKLQTLVYDILPGYAIGPRKLSAHEQFFVGAQLDSSKFVTNNSNYIRRLFAADHVAYASSNKTKIV